MKKFSILLTVVLLTVVGAAAQNSEPSLTAKATVHSWIWHNDVPGSRDHVTIGDVGFKLFSRTNGISLRSAYVDTAQPYVFSGFPRVRRLTDSGEAFVTSVLNAENGLINHNGVVLFAGGANENGGNAEFISSCNGTPLPLPLWDLSFGVTVSPQGACYDGEHVAGDSVTLILLFASGERVELAKVFFLKDDLVQVSFHKDAAMFLDDRFATKNRLFSGQSVPLNLLGHFMRHYYSGLFTVAIGGDLMMRTKMDPPKLVVRSVNAGGYPGEVGVVLDELLMQTANLPGDDNKFFLGEFSKRFSKIPGGRIF